MLLRIILFSSYVEMFFSYTKSDFDCEYIALNPLIFKSVYTRHNVSSDVIVRAFGGGGFWGEKRDKKACLKDEISTLYCRVKRAETSKNHKFLPA